MQQVQIRALRNIHIGNGRDLRTGECAPVDAYVAAVLCNMSETVELVDPQDRDALIAAGRAEIVRQNSDATRERYAFARF
ncbi:MAG: hypothetical protein QM750_00135 [Rubrivivax sp.]